MLSEPSFATYWWDRTQHLVLPALTLGLGLYGEYTLIVRTSMLETLGEDYVLTARAKGLRNFAIVWRHGLRNAMLPLITLIALSFGYIVAGAIVVEDVFSYPGIGLLTIQAIDQRDYPAAAGHLFAADRRGDPGQPAGRPALLRSRPTGDHVNATTTIDPVQLADAPVSSRKGFIRSTLLGDARPWSAC